MLKAEFDVPAAPRIRGNFNPVRVMVDHGKVVTLGQLDKPELEVAYREKIAREASRALCKLDRDTLKGLKSFAMTIDMPPRIGIDPMRPMQPDDADKMISYPFVPEPVVQNDDLDPWSDLLVASRLRAVFVRDDSVPERNLPRFFLTLVHPTANPAFPALDLMTAPPQPEEPQYVYTATPAQVMLLKGLFGSDKKKAPGLKPAPKHLETPSPTKTQ